MLRDMRAMLLAVLAVTALAVVVGCVSNSPARRLVDPLDVIVKERFRVMQGERLIGFLLLQEVAGSPYFRIETPSRNWVGDADLNGRFFKNELFRKIPRELGIYSMKDGLALLFEETGALRILPLEGRGEPTEAAAHKLMDQATVATKK